MDTSIGANIRRLREAYGYTQEYLAHRIGVTRETLWSYEKGKVNPRIDHMINLAREFGITLNDIADPRLEMPAEEIERRVTLRRIEELAARVEDQGLIDHILKYLAEKKGASGHVTGTQHGGGRNTLKSKIA